MSYTFFDHTGDIGVRLAATSLDGLFVTAATALTDTIVESDPFTDRAVHDTIEARAAALDLLLVDWLSELLFRFDARHMLVRDCTAHVTQASDCYELTATVESVRFDPAHHRIKVLVKGITYHALEVRQTPDGWQATLVFDV